MRILAVPLVSLLAVFFNASLGHANSCGAIAHNTGCDGSVASSDITEGICKNAKQMTKTVCGSASTCAGDISAFGPIENKLKTVDAATYASDSAANLPGYWDSGTTFAGKASECNTSITAPTRDPAVSELDAARKYKTAATSALNDAYKYAGECRSRKQICKCQVEKNTDAINSNAAIIDKPALITKMSNAYGCDSFNDTVPTAVAQQNFDAVAGADKTIAKLDPDSDPKGGKGGPGGDTGGKDPGSNTKPQSGKGGGANPLMQMAQAALPMIMQKLAEKDPNADNTTPEQPKIEQTPCGPGIVGGSGTCPAAPATATSDSWNTGKGATNYQTASANHSAFNPGDATGTPGTGNKDLAPASAQQAGLGSAVVPNGGGQMPQGAQAGGGGGSGGGGMAGGTQAGYNVKEMMKGETSHGALANQNAAMSTAAGGSSGGYTYGKGAGEEPPANWADWLPKGAKDPLAARALAGGNMRPMQIQSKEVNIFNRISDHIKSRCALGLLRDCVP